MSFTNTDQMREIFLSCGMGFLLGVLNDGFRLAKRYLTPPGVVAFFMDAINGALSAVAVFLFCLAMTQGSVRFYTLVAVLCGSLVYHFTVGKVTARVTDLFLALLGRLGDCCERTLDRVLCHFKRWGAVGLRKVLEKSEKIRKKAKKFSKKGCNQGVE